MDPPQQPQTPYPAGYPPQSPPPVTNPAYQQTPPPYVAPQTPYTPQQAPQPQSWYTPPPDKNAGKPASVDSYLHTGDAPQNPAGVQGQSINGQYSIDYLNQMAAPAKKTIDKKYIFIGIGAALALMAAAFLLFSSPAAVSTPNETKLFTTVVDTSVVTKTANRNIDSSKLSAFNSSFNGYLINVTTAMQKPLSDSGMDGKKLQTAAVKAPYHDQKLVDTLADAKLNAIYDRIYANQMTFKIKNMLTLMESIEKNNKRKSMQDFLAANKPSLESLQKVLETYKSSDEANL